MSNGSEENFLREKFKEFYSRHNVVSVPEIEKREFGIGDFGKKISKRHMNFSDYSELNIFLRTEAPFFISYSAAYYKEPAARPMENKGLIGADLIYEFDVSDIDSDCKENHDFWFCASCGSSGKGTPQRCPNCSETVQQYKFPCEKCIGETKKQVFYLLDILKDELGFSEGISVNFSGNAGFHVHVREKAIRGLSAEARIELVDYLTLAGFSPERNGFDISGKMLQCPKISEARGAQARVLKFLIDSIQQANADWLVQYGCISLTTSQKHAGRELASYIVQNKARAIESIKNGLLPYIGSQKVASIFWKSLIENAVRLASVKLDRQTSVDIYKIVRVPDTLHGSTGLIAKTLPLQALKDFNPFEHALAFGNQQIKVFINKAPRFKMAGNCFGPFEKESAELPEYAAIYLLAKGVAKLA